MTDCQANRSTNEPLVTVTGSQSAAGTLIHGGIRWAECLPAGIANSKNCLFLRSGQGFGHRSTNSGLASLNQWKEHFRRPFGRWPTPECISNTASRIALESSGIRIQ